MDTQAALKVPGMWRMLWRTFWRYCEILIAISILAASFRPLTRRRAKRLPATASPPLGQPSLRDRRSRMPKCIAWR